MEIIAIEDEEENRMYVIHAMKITKQYFYLLEEGERYVDIDEVNVDEEVKRVSEAVAKGEYRQATKRESMAVRLAGLSKIVHTMQENVENDKELVER